ncbi:hypothetical protein [Jiangella alkaliphila]|uniref:Uncharacterized protein n=2 Tax=Jiangella alkaliphila TaxID=419479 RepID=A0A1H2LDB6_9ACTN|nr:hypothetical protein [Jiangella alkaliphila]SDU78919.1 hypothetical protein SAMN04488563_5892 [Jiangella alkaliphila]
MTAALAWSADDECGIRWCDERSSHRGQHRRYVGSTTVRGTREHDVTVTVMHVGWSTADRHVEVVVADDGHAVTLRPTSADLNTLGKLLGLAR